MKDCRSFHLIGVGGIGMSAIAEMLVRRGFAVSGSDEVLSPLTRRLQSLGVKIDQGHDAAFVGEAGCVIYSSSIRESNPEMDEAKKRSLKLCHRSEALAFLTAGTWLATVAGSHGKSTATAMLGAIYAAAGLTPTVVVGAKVPELGGNVGVGGGSHMVIEADESDASFTAYSPDAILITNIEWEHLDRFAKLKDVMAAFQVFLKRLRPGGKWVGCGECPQTLRLLKSSSASTVIYGYGRQWDYGIEGVTPEQQGSRFSLAKCGSKVGDLTLNVPGEHNVLNATGAMALAMENGVSFAAAREGLARFKGVARRFEVAHDDGRFMVVDDYAHHPTEIIAAIRTARSFKGKKITAIFQPHRFSRVKGLLSQFAGSFDGADEVIITDIFAASEDPIPGVNGKRLAEEVGRCRPKVRYVPRRHLTEEIMRMKKDGILLLIMGAGDIGQVSEEIAVACRS